MTKGDLSVPEKKGKTAVDILNAFGDAISKRIEPVTSLLCFASMVFVVMMVAVVVLDVFLRNIDAIVPGINELQTFLMVIVTFFSLAYVTIRKRHIAIDILLNKLNPANRSLITLILNVLTLVIMILMIGASVRYGMSKASTFTPLLRLPISLAAYAISFCTSINAIVLLAEVFKSLASAFDNFKNRLLIPIAVVVFVPLVIFASPVWLNWLNITKGQVGVLSLVLMLILVFASLPIAYSVAIAGFIGVSTLGSFEAAFNLLGSFLYTKTADYQLTVMPFFVLMSSLAAVSGISTDLFKSIKILLGKLPGSLAMATVIGGAAFGAVCGDSLATASAIGKVALPEMKRENYADTLAGGSVAVGGTLGSMIPPSMVFIIYALIVEESVGKLLMAGVGPGILITVLLCITIYILVKQNPKLATRGEATTVIEKIKGLRSSWGMLVLILLVLGGIYTGYLTPVEAGAFGALGAFVFSYFRKALNKENIKDALVDAAEICGVI
ncbi:MAG TPA: TRAP transporter large permease subunit, partial [Firmicutes bacterium]|nr:TRAP transporter large permease subunit [Bacillota bacterium]